MVMARGILCFPHHLMAETCLSNFRPSAGVVLMSAAARHKSDLVSELVVSCLVTARNSPASWRIGTGEAF